MSLHLLTVTNTSRTQERCPGFYFYAGWLPTMGFIPGALVQVLPVPDEVVFNLCDENIKCYSELDADTKAQGGALLQVCTSGVERKNALKLRAGGSLLYDAGLSIGDSLIAIYEHGHIRVRKLPANARVIKLLGLKDNHTGQTFPKVWLRGEWLPEYGFMPDSPVTVASELGSITFTVWNEGAEKYNELVRHVRQHKMKIIQVKESPRNGKLYPYIMTTGSCVEKAEFTTGEHLIATCEHGVIKLQRLDLVRLGF